jgi:uncharacterized protein (UPF0332 family)
VNAENWMIKAKRNLDSAAILLEHDDPESACNRAYYAMFNAARAALWTAGTQELAMSKTHSGMIAAFGQYLAKPGHIDSEHGRKFALESKRRLVSDYEGMPISYTDADEAIGNATRFVDAVSTYIEGR